MAWILGVLLVAAAGPARAADDVDAKTHYQRATAHFAVGEYREAATEYEEAFKLKQDPAILFNAAQAHRLAGDNQKALLLYNNVIKLYPTSQYATDSKERIEKLAQSGTSPPAAVPGDSVARTPPPVASAPVAPPAAPASPPPPAAAPLPAPALASPAPIASSTTLIATAPPSPPPDQEDKPVYTRWWFWAAAGGVVAIGVIAIVALSSGSAGSWSNVPDVRASLVHW
jgi:tetratricopeptide (TPR) repeat protein